MSVPENTTNRDPLLHLIGALPDCDGTEYITGMEAAGQRQVVASQVIPTEIRGGTEETLTALGFVLGDRVPNDELFRHAALPPGWSKQATEHSMHSSIVDEHGRKRCSIFYKAAYYDRRADMRIENLDSYAFAIACGEAQLVLDEQWATWEGMAAAFIALEEREAQAAVQWRRRGDEGNPHAAKYVAEHEQQQAAYARLLDELVEAPGEVSPR